MTNWTYELNKDTLYIKVEPGFTNDLLPSILSQVFKALPLSKVEKVRSIHIVRRIET